MDTWNSTPNETYVSLENEDALRPERYSKRIRGLWVVGIYECSVNDDGRRKLLEAHYFIVEQKDKYTLESFILQEVKHGSILFTDEWKGDCTLRYYGFNHITVNHSKEYVTNEGHHTNTMEVVWHHLKTKILRRMSGVRGNILGSYLQEESIRSKFKNFWLVFEHINSIAIMYT